MAVSVLVAAPAGRFARRPAEAMARLMSATATTSEFRTALRSRNRVAINQLAARLLEERTPLREQWFSVAHVLVRTGEVALAVSAAERGVQESGATAGARFQLAHVLSLVGRQREAVALVSGLAADQLNPIERDHFLGTCALEIGDFELANDAFERVLAAWRGSGATWLSVAALPETDDPALLDRMTAAESAISSTPPDSRARWHYAKGMVLDRLGSFDEAFSEFAAGAELVRAIRPYDPRADRREVDMLTAEFNREVIDRFANEVPERTDRAILVSGLPRSGTTLVEQILTSHSAIAGGGELPFASILRREIGGNSWSRLEAFGAAHGVDRLAGLYLHLGDEHFGSGQRFVDKCLSNSRDLGILASVLPEARIIWLRRDPLDCAWSCFRTFFSHGNDWSWSLAGIAAHFQAEDILFAHWQSVLGERMLAISYEDITQDPKAQTARILGHVGLDHEPALEAVHKTERAVTTASLAQVRRPVYRTSVGSADRYREYLLPFVEAYEAVASAR